MQMRRSDASAPDDNLSHAGESFTPDAAATLLLDAARQHRRERENTTASDNRNEALDGCDSFHRLHDVFARLVKLDGIPVRPVTRHQEIDSSRKVEQREINELPCRALDVTVPKVRSLSQAGPDAWSRFGLPHPVAGPAGKKGDSGDREDRRLSLTRLSLGGISASSAASLPRRNRVS